jgi:long-chain acyl-CoA synthetase
MTIEIEVGLDSSPPARCTFTRDELADRLDQSHWWLVRQKLERITHSGSVYWAHITVTRHDHAISAEDSGLNRIVERFTRLLRDQPRRPLIHLPLTQTSLTAEQLWDAAIVLRRRLEDLAVGSDQLLIYAAGSRPELIAIWLACGCLDVPLLPIDAGTTMSEIMTLADRFGATAMIVADTVSGLAATGNAEAFAPGVILVRPHRVVPRPDIYAGATVLKLTSGSTGLPKATFTTDEQLVNDSEHITTAMDIRPVDCQMAAIPLSHAYGIGCLVVPLLMFGTAIVLREAFVPHRFIADARTYGARVFPGVPFIFEHFNSHLSPGAWPLGLERLISAGARLEMAAVRGFYSSFGVKIHSFYGATETGGITFDDTSSIPDEPTVGRPLPDVNISLLPEDGAPRDGGRVYVAGSAVSSGYAGGERFESDNGSRGFLTGDLGRFDAHGQLQLTGRVSSFINVAGRKVQPEEVEAVLRSMPGITDVRVLGVADPARGQQIVACIVAPGGDPGTLAVRRFCAARLAPYKIPRRVVLLDCIPLTDRGKTNRQHLQTLIEEHLRGVSPTDALDPEEIGG